MELRQVHWKQSQPLAEHYIHEFEKVRNLFEYDPWSSKTLYDRTEWLDRGAMTSAPREAVAQALEQFNLKYNRSSQVMESIDRFRHKDALVIVGGQQAGLFTGPLLVIHKAISIIRAAREAEQRLQRPVIPIFWIAGEDHDLDEVNHLYYTSAQLKLEKLEIDSFKNKATRTPISRLAIYAEQWEAIVEQLDAALAPSDFKPYWMDRIRELTAKSDTLVDLFAGMMSLLFGSEGLVLMDAHDANLRTVEAPFFKQLIRNQRSISQSLVDSKERLIQSGYEPQAEVRESNANIFIVYEGERLLLEWHENVYTDKTGRISMSESEIIDLVEQQPENFSNNVFTRPLMQNYVFPVLSVVLGAGEIAYWALLKGAFQAVDSQMPIILPRLEFTLVEGTVQKHMGKLDVSFEEAISCLKEKREQWLSDQDALGLPERFAAVKEQFSALYDPLLQAIGTINPSLRQLGETNQQKIIEQIQFLEVRSKDAFEAQFEAVNRQFERIQISITPFGKKQERVYNVLSFLNKYGDGWIKELLNADMEWNGQHNAVYL